MTFGNKELSSSIFVYVHISKIVDVFRRNFDQISKYGHKAEMWEK